MTGHIAFCPHFHQPHFQLHRTREEAFANSYRPWQELLEKAVLLDKFYINIHFSGPFLYWIRDQKPDYLKRWRVLLQSGKIGIIGGLADEAFVQLSSRSDDYMYQLSEYDLLMADCLGIKAIDWQGIHIVERECGEMLLHRVAGAANILGAKPLFYLDAETFFKPHFMYPGSEYDYCWQHFGFKDPFAKTTISHIPDELLYFGLRDEIENQEFFVYPVHTQFRYQLLKRQSFTPQDKTLIKPQHYYYYIKDILEKAHAMAKVWGRDLEPLVVIFEDAEKFGQWSKDPAGDTEWLFRFFDLVEADPELNFTGLGHYWEQQGFFDTYPVSSSHSYPEWENWTAKRGIRGVTLGDERLRRVICRLRDLEQAQSNWEFKLLNHLSWTAEAEKDMKMIMMRSLQSSPERYRLIENLLKQQPNQEWLRLYRLTNRVRNLLYQEDPKWASRHPSYGSSPYYDALGLVYLETIIRQVDIINQKPSCQVELLDWNMDGQKEILAQNLLQTMVLIPHQGGCICYHHVIDDNSWASDTIKLQAEQDIEKMTAYSSIYRYGYPLIFTETDSELRKFYYTEGGRREVARNSMRCKLWLEDRGLSMELGDFGSGSYEVETFETNEEGIFIRLTRKENLKYGNENNVFASISKEFLMTDTQLSIVISAVIEPALPGKIYLVPEIVTSATPSDEMDFRPASFLGWHKERGKKADFTINDPVILTPAGLDFDTSGTINASAEEFDYVYEINSADGHRFSNIITCTWTGEMPEKVEVLPAVRNYYADYVFPDQSRLGYHTSGINLEPHLLLKEGKTDFGCTLSWKFARDITPDVYHQAFYLVKP